MVANHRALKSAIIVRVLPNTRYCELTLGFLAPLSSKTKADLSVPAGEA
jgi:hypothetical protein